MTFFNKKEDVIKIELTPHGRKLLSEGNLKPHYYAFFDDDVLYDSRRGGFSETNLESKSRILTNTPSLRPQTNYKGADTKLTNSRTHETENHLLTPIGSNRVEEKKSSGWDISFLHNTASATTAYYSSSTSQTLQIPQISTTIEFKMKPKIGLKDLPPGQLLGLQGGLWNSDIVDIIPQQLLINILESNGFNFRESFEMEVFLYEQDKQTYNKLEFEPQTNFVVDDMYIDTEDDFSALFKPEQHTNDPKMVEYWLRLYFDEEISDMSICSGIKNLNEKDIYLDLDVECPDTDPVMTDIYSTNVTDLEDCEE